MSPDYPPPLDPPDPAALPPPRLAPPTSDALSWPAPLPWAAPASLELPDPSPPVPAAPPAARGRERLRQRATDASSKALERAAQEALRARGGLKKAADSSIAAAVGGAGRSGRKRLGELPGFSTPADFMAARHCVDVLADKLREDPGDPRRHVWLAEALLLMRRDMQAWVRFRGITDPSSILVRTAVRGVTRLGEEPGADDPAVRLLRRAFTLARGRVRRGDTDPVALHVLARVYLARGMPADALKLARLAGVVPSAERADVLVTAARGFRSLGRRDDAARVAERAVHHGSTLGYAVLAQLLLTDRSQLGRNATGYAAGWIELRRKVRPEDRARYFGATRAPAEVARAVKSAQWQKVSATVSDAVNLADRTRRGLMKEPR